MLEALVLAVMIAAYEFERRFARRIAALASEVEAKVVTRSIAASLATIDQHTAANDNARAVVLLDPNAPAAPDVETLPPTAVSGLRRVHDTGAHRPAAKRGAA